jgi:hypothetical protein
MGIIVRVALPQIVERRYIRDFPVPISADDYETNNGWRCISIPPSEDPGWKIFDRRKDRRTGWQRFRIVWGAS